MHRHIVRIAEEDCASDHRSRRKGSKLERTQAGSGQLQHHESLRFRSLGEGRALGRSGIDDRRPADWLQDLVAMNVSTQSDRYIAGHVAGADDVWAEAEGEVAGPAGRSLDALMKAQHAHIG